MLRAPWLALLLASCASAGERDAIDEALRIHRSAIVVDGHNDLPWALRTKSASSAGASPTGSSLPLFDRFDISQPQPGFHTDIPRLASGGVGAQFWSVYVPADTAKRGVALHQTLEQIDLVLRMIRRYPGTFEQARTVDDIVRIRAAGRIACLMGAEGGHSIEGSTAVLRMLYGLGVRYLTLTHSDTNDLADSATDDPRHGGLSALGEEVVREMNALGMLVDLSHVSVETMEDVLRISSAPVIASHSSCFALAPHPRNVPDEILRRIAANGGVVMLNFYSGFLVEESARAMADAFQVRRRLREEHPDDADFEKALGEWRAAHPIARGSVRTLVDHVDHAVRIAGIDCVGLGSDFDGIGTTPEGLEDVSCYPRITREMVHRGYSADAVAKVLGGNTLRVLRRAEAVAAGERLERAKGLEPSTSTLGSRL